MPLLDKLKRKAKKIKADYESGALEKKIKTKARNAVYEGGRLVKRGLDEVDKAVYDAKNPLTTFRTSRSLSDMADAKNVKTEYSRNISGKNTRVNNPNDRPGLKLRVPKTMGTKKPPPAPPARTGSKKPAVDRREAARRAAATRKARGAGAIKPPKFNR